MSKAFSCVVAPLNKGMTVPPLVFDGKPIESYFPKASNNDIALTFDLSRMGTSIRNDAFTDISRLHNALDKITNNTLATSPINLAVIFANELPGHPKLLGAMFDLGFRGPSPVFDKIPREGCAVFIDAARRERPAAPDDEAIYSAIHELGHVFNLGHIENELGFMMSSKPDGSHLAARDFTKSHRDLLKLCSTSKFIEPGGSNYGVIGTLTGGGDYSVAFNTGIRAPFGLDLNIEMSPREFWNFEPVELDITVRVAPGVNESFVVPDTFDPGFANFDIWIDWPDGERRRYAPTKQLCAAPASRKVTPDTPFHRDISIFGQNGGYTFRRAGVHRITAVMILPDGSRLESNVLEINVLPWLDDSAFRAFRGYLTRKGTPEALFYRSADVARGVVRSVAKFAEEFKKTPSGAAAEYALGRALLSKAETAAGAAESRELRREAKARLRRAVRSERLSPHRHRKAITILQATTARRRSG